MERLRRRSDFRATASGVRASGRAFVLQARRRADDGVVRVGFTVSKQVGNAVERNRVRRRLRELVRVSTAASPPAGGLHAGHDYVLVGRRAALQTPFGDMVRELDVALSRVHALERSPTGEGRPGSLHEAGSRSGRVRPPGQRRRPAEHPQSME